MDAEKRARALVLVVDIQNATRTKSCKHLRLRLSWSISMLKKEPFRLDPRKWLVPRDNPERGFPPWNMDDDSVASVAIATVTSRVFFMLVLFVIALWNVSAVLLGPLAKELLESIVVVEREAMVGSRNSL